MKNTLFILYFTLFATMSYSATCIFTGLGDGSSWSDKNNWSCGSVPNTNQDHVIIPQGFNVLNDKGSNLTFNNGYDLTILGGLDMGDKKLEMSHPTSYLTVEGSLTNVDRLFFNGDADGYIGENATLTVKHLKTSADAELHIEARCINVTDKLFNLSQSGIVGTGCINFTGTNFNNTGADGIFGCTVNDITECSLDGGALPVTFVSVEATTQNSQATILWQTATELNNDFFVIEHYNANTLAWDSIDMVWGSGYSNGIKRYQHTIFNLGQGVNIFRLKQVDFDGKSMHSQQVVVSVDAPDSEIRAFPNPANNLVTFDNLYSDIIIVYNLAGEEVLVERKQNPASNQQTLDISMLDPGMYIVRSGNKALKISKR